jgi:hypothetical protein
LIEKEEMAETVDQPIVTQQNVIAKESNTKTVVGFNSLTLPTPDSVKAVFKMIAFFVGLVALGATSFREIPESVQKQILEYTVFIGLCLQKAEDFWGIKITS